MERERERGREGERERREEEQIDENRNIPNLLVAPSYSPKCI